MQKSAGTRVSNHHRRLRLCIRFRVKTEKLCGYLVEFPIRIKSTAAAGLGFFLSPRIPFQQKKKDLPLIHDPVYTKKANKWVCCFPVTV